MSVAADGRAPLAHAARVWGDLAVRAFRSFIMDRCDEWAGAMAFFSLAALPGCIVVIYLAANMLLAEETSKQILTEWLGPRADFVRAFLVEAKGMSPGELQEIGIAGLVAFVYGAVSYFSCLKDSLETVWDVRREEFGILPRISRLARSLLVTLGVQIIVVGTVVARSILPDVGQSSLVQALPYRGYLFLGVLEGLIAFSFLFALTLFYFKFLSPVRQQWRYVWPGAAATALLLMLVRPLVAHIMENGGWAGLLGTAGSLVSVLVWFYVFGAVLLYGAELTRHYVEMHDPGLRERRQASETVRARREALQRDLMSRARKGVTSILHRSKS